MDIVENLRGLSRGDNSDFSLGNEAADEITRLRKRVAELEASNRNLIAAAEMAMIYLENIGSEYGYPYRRLFHAVGAAKPEGETK